MQKSKILSKFYNNCCGTQLVYHCGLELYGPETINAHTTYQVGINFPYLRNGGLKRSAFKDLTGFFVAGQNSSPSILFALFCSAILSQISLASGSLSERDESIFQ